MGGALHAAADLVHALEFGTFEEARTLAELVELGKREPGKLSYGSLGVGSTSFLSAELLNSMAGLDIQNVPYKGSGQIQADLISGQIAIYFDGITAALGQIRAGRLAALAVISAAWLERTVGTLEL